MLVRVAVCIAFTFAACLATMAVVKEPYMDEIFHVPQTQRYCRGELSSWDPKITTLPGFHLFAAAHGLIYYGEEWTGEWLLSAISGSRTPSELCTLGTLRALSFLLWTFNIYLLKELHQMIHTTGDAGGHLQWSICFSLLPFYHFYVVLFYTEMMSMTFLFSTHLMFLQNKTHLAALLGAQSILIRQTNVIWVAFFLWNFLAADLKLDSAPSHRRTSVFLQLLHEVKAFVGKAWRLKFVLAKKSWSCALVLISFVVFVYINGGIVVGDRNAHQPAMHGAQIPYLFLFLFGCFFTYYCNMNRIYTSLKSCTNGWAPCVMSVVSFGCISLLLLCGRIGHPYLIADNRHLLFYVWRRFLSKDVIAAALIPVSWISALITTRGLIEQKGYLWLTAFLICCFASLVPSSLLEFRYFLPAAAIVALYLPPPSMSLSIQTAVYFGADCLLLYLFLARPFVSDDGSVARFIF